MPKYFWRAHRKWQSWHVKGGLLDANPWETFLSPPHLCTGRKGREGKAVSAARKMSDMAVMCHWCPHDGWNCCENHKMLNSLRVCHGLTTFILSINRCYSICLGYSYPISATFICFFQDLAHIQKPSPTSRFASNISCGFCWAEQEKTSFSTTVNILGGIQMAYSDCLLHVIALLPTGEGSSRTCLSIWRHLTCIDAWVREDIRSRLEKNQTSPLENLELGWRASQPARPGWSWSKRA